MLIAINVSPNLKAPEERNVFIKQNPQILFANQTFEYFFTQYPLNFSLFFSIIILQIHGGIMSFSINMDVLNNFDSNDFLKKSSLKSSLANETSYESADFADFHYISKQISQIDSSLSYISRDNSKFDFSFRFKNSTKESLSVNGYFNERETTAEINLNFQFKREVLVNNQKIMKSYSAEVKIISSNFRKNSLSQKTEKEDITEFFRRIIDSVIKMSRDKKKIISGVILRGDDLKEITEAGNREFLQLLYSLIQTIYSNQRLKESFEKSKEKESIFLIPERKISKTITKEKEYSDSLKIDVKINELQEDIVSNDEAKN